MIALCIYYNLLTKPCNSKGQVLSGKYKVFFNLYFIYSLVDKGELLIIGIGRKGKFLFYSRVERKNLLEEKLCKEFLAWILQGSKIYQ